ncbi:WD repeat-containing protein 1-like [Sycon ciliatum]|uniref:WD repeat-containing protein 1-like n=1 Tax=Sycon ciliatum TaxID=27933 RepID=UPI0031F684CE
MSYTPAGVLATLPRTQRGCALVLSGDPKGKNFVYTNGQSVIVRDIADPSIADVYTQHAAQTTVARYAPSGFYIASADVSGKVRIWDTTNAEHILKYEYPCLGGPIKDLQWSPDSKRIVVVGEGREAFGRVFLWDSGSSVGEIQGHSKTINTVDYRPTRPFRIVTGGDDFALSILHGPPFKFNTNMRVHKRFVNSVRYAPNGEQFFSAAQDGKMFLWDGKSGDQVAEFTDGENAHKGGIYAASWNGDGTRILTASGDKTCKIWDVESRSVVNTFEIGKNVDDQQLGCLWQGDYLLSVSLSGVINYLDPASNSVSRVVRGHSKNITTFSISEDRNQFFTGSYDSSTMSWNSASSECKPLSGSGHSNGVQNISIAGGNFVSCAMDDTVRFAELPAEVPEFKTSVKMPSCPADTAATKDGYTVVACVDQVVLMKDRAIVSSVKTDYQPTAIGIREKTKEVVVGAKDNNLRLFKVDGNQLSFVRDITTMAGEPTCIVFADDQEHFAVGSGAREVGLFNANTFTLVRAAAVNHTARVTDVAFSPDSKRFASSSLDTNVYVWNIENENKIKIGNAHPLSTITGLVWMSNTQLASSGSDCCIRKWNIE